MVTLSSFIFVNGTVKQYNFIDTCRLVFNELNTANELYSRARKFREVCESLVVANISRSEPVSIVWLL